MTDACALVQENRCEEVYEKKCAINMTEVTGDEEVTSCSRPLYRRCGDTSTSLVRRRRDTLQQHRDCSRWLQRRAQEQPTLPDITLEAVHKGLLAFKNRARGADFWTKSEAMLFP